MFETETPVNLEDYVILKCISYMSLELEMEKYIKSGWKPLGAPFIGGFGEVKCIHQALIK